MNYVLTIFEGHMTVMLKTKDYDTAYSVAHNLMITLKREVIIVTSEKPPTIIKYVRG